jgi:hypothetical protein
MDLALAIIDKFLLQYNVGQALVVLFVVSVLGVLPLRSFKTLGVTFISFGLLFVLTPESLTGLIYRFFGLSLLFIGPMIVVAARR